MECCFFLYFLCLFYPGPVAIKLQNTLNERKKTTSHNNFGIIYFHDQNILPLYFNVLLMSSHTGTTYDHCNNFYFYFYFTCHFEHICIYKQIKFKNDRKSLNIKAKALCSSKHRSKSAKILTSHNLSTEVILKIIRFIPFILNFRKPALFCCLIIKCL